jgi:hypothetical protein
MPIVAEQAGNIAVYGPTAVVVNVHKADVKRIQRVSSTFVSLGASVVPGAQSAARDIVLQFISISHISAHILDVTSTGVERCVRVPDVSVRHVAFCTLL